MDVMDIMEGSTGKVKAQYLTDPGVYNHINTLIFERCNKIINVKNKSIFKSNPP